jgi:hypothetical protein
MGAGDQPLDPQVLSLAMKEATARIASLPPAARRLVLPASYYAFDAAHAWQRRRRRDALTHIRRVIREHVLADLADPANPLGSEVVLAEAIAIGRRMLERRARGYHARFGNGLVEPDAAPGYAAEALLAWGKAESRKPGSTGSMWAYVRGVMHHLLVREIEQALRALDPGAHAQHRLAASFLDELRSTRPELSEIEARLVASELARAELWRRGGYVERASDETALERVAGTENLYDRARLSLLLDRIRTLVHGTDYSDIDRDTWTRFEAAGLTGRDISWAEARVAPHTGAQRLLALFRKLARDLADWESVD